MNGSLSFIEPDGGYVRQPHKLDPQHFDEWNNSQTLATALAVTASGRFLIGFNDGSLVQQSRSLSQTIYPRQFYRPLSRAAILTMVVHPDPSIQILLAGYADGVIRLFKINHPRPLLEWHIDTQRSQLHSVRKLVWSRARCSSFFSLDSLGRVMAWEMAHTDQRENKQPDCNWTESSSIIETVPHLTDQEKLNSIQDITSSPGLELNVCGKRQYWAPITLLCSNEAKLYWLNSCLDNSSEKELELLKNTLEAIKCT